MDDKLLLLEKEYCPPIDSALFFAILSDYDLSLGTSISEVRSTLDALKANAEAEETAAFDPSGSSNFQRDESVNGTPDRAQSWDGDALSRTEETDLTSVAHSLDSLGIEDEQIAINGGIGNEHNAEFESLPNPAKAAKLVEMFPNLKPFDISYTLKKSQYNYSKTVEELLNQVFLLEEPSSDGEPHSVPRGIEAFASSSHNQHHKSKSKRRKKTLQARRSSSTPPPLHNRSTNSPTTSKWEQAKDDIEFLAQRTYIPTQTIASTYHKNNAALPATILALCSTEITNPYVEPDDPILKTHAIGLAHAFPTIPSQNLIHLVHLTHPSTASTHDLAAVLAVTPPATSTTPALIPQYTRPSLPPAPINPTKRPSPPSTPLSFPHALPPSTLATSALRHASTLRTQSRSNALLSLAHRQTSVAASALAEKQSTRASVDLHGINVKDGVRIARERVEAWWDDGAAEWAREGKVQREGGYRIVVGLGSHSEGGRGKLGPAVGGMLVKEGWRVEVGRAELVIWGKARR